MLKEFLKENWLWLSVGTVLTIVLVKHMEAVRGYEAIGGELLILPLLGFMVMFYRQIREDGLFDVLLEDGDEEDGDEDDE